MEYTQLQHCTAQRSQSRRFVYRSAYRQDASPHPLRRATDASDALHAPRPLFAKPAEALLLHFRVAVRRD